MSLPTIILVLLAACALAGAALSFAAARQLKALLASQKSDNSERFVAIEVQLNGLRESLDKLTAQQEQHRLRALEDANSARERDSARHEELKRELREELVAAREKTSLALNEFRSTLSESMHKQTLDLEKRHSEALQTQAKALEKGLETVRADLQRALSLQSEQVNEKVRGLTEVTDKRLKEIGGKVDERLAEGFEKTNATFLDITKRLTMIDAAQQKITELSSNVVSLQSILADKKSRGAFGEVQLAGLVRNVMPENTFALQHQFSNNRQADCVLFLPEPTGTLAIDSKFPLEAYQRMTDPEASDDARKVAQREFKAAIRKHITDIAERYIIPGETADGAMMFIPAEAVFAEIQAAHQDLVDEAHRKRVWMVSPTTLWAVLNTSRAVLKDAETREQVHVIQEHLRMLSVDFGRFRVRMDKLATHIDQANRDVEQINKSAKKITSRFDKIEKVELEPLDGSHQRALLDMPDDEAELIDEDGDD